jgi:hypothetical protein
MPERYRIAREMMQVSYSVGHRSEWIRKHPTRDENASHRNIGATSIENSLRRGKMGSGGQDIVDDAMARGKGSTSVSSIGRL